MQLRAASRFSPAVALTLIGCTGLILEGNDPRPTRPGGVEGGVMPSAVRRLAHHEIDRSIEDLLGIEGEHTAGLPLDARVSGYSANANLAVDEATAIAIGRMAEELSRRAVDERWDAIVPCDSAEAGCARTFVESFATRAFRRPPSAQEIDDLLGVFDAAAASPGTFEEGVATVIRAVFQSASFLYVPQIGVGDTEDRTLDPFETASALSYFLTGAPPDAALLEAASRDELADPADREAHARRLLAEDARTDGQIVRFIDEWLGLDRIDSAVRNAAEHDFETLRPLMREETSRFARELLSANDDTFESLVAADFTMAEDSLAAFYGLDGGSGWTRRSLEGTPRRGVLSQAAFLAANAKPDESHPVRRGVTILTRVLCRDIPPPSGAVGEAAMSPLPEARTTRERYVQHSSDPVCAGCHSQIDPFGFAFEEFDQIGAYRSEENGNPVDASGALTETDVDGPFQDAAGMLALLSGSEEAHACFARQLLRFAAARSSTAIERGFVETWRAMPAERRTRLTEIWVELVRSELFVRRRVVE